MKSAPTFWSLSKLLTYTRALDIQVRDAYRKKGWAFTNTDKFEQCEREGFVDSVKARTPASFPSLPSPARAPLSITLPVMQAEFLEER